MSPTTPGFVVGLVGLGLQVLAVTLGAFTILVLTLSERAEDHKQRGDNWRAGLIMVAVTVMMLALGMILASWAHSMTYGRTN